MGNFGSQQFIRNDEIVGQGKQVLIYAKKMRLTNKELDRLYHEFSKFENPKTNLAEISRIFQYCSCEYSVFSIILYQIFDKTKSGFLNFMEYIIINWFFLTCNDDDFAILCFNLFDTEMFVFFNFYIFSYTVYLSLLFNIYFVLFFILFNIYLFYIYCIYIYIYIY
jgi:hypothetical protein